MKIVESYSVGAEKVQVLVNIEDENGEFRYHVQLPEITKPTSALLAEIKHRLITEVAIGSYELLDPKVLQNVKSRFRENAYKLIDKLMPGLPQDTKDYLISILMHEMLGLENIEYLLYDDALEEVVINSSAEPVRVYHKKYGWLITNITISNENQILNYANIIARRVGRQITTLNPLLDAHLITGDRSNAVLFPISSKGNTLTIRKFARDPWTVTDLINNKTCTPEIFALIWLAMEYELNILISGGTASGKTSFLNVCMSFAPFNHRILSIEDTRELQFPKFLYWAPMIVRQPNPEGKGEVCMYPGSLFVGGNGELCEISDYVEKKLRNGARKLKDNVVAANGDGDTILAGDPLSLRYEKEKIKTFSKITDRKYICSVLCEDGTEFSVTENTKLPVLTKGGNIALLTPFEIKKNGGFMPLYTKLDVKADTQKISIFDIFDKKDIYACGLRKEYLLLEKNLREKYKLRELAEICGLKRQSFNYYRKTGIISMYAFKKLIALSDYDLDYFENKIKYLKGRGANSNKVKIPRVVDEDLAYFAGFVLAEKFINKNRIIITQKEKINYILEELVNKLFGINLGYKHGEYNKYGLFSSVISCLMRELFNATTSKNISVPKIIMRSPENIISAFLGGYIDGDGSVKHNNVSMSSINKSIVTEFKYLLIRLGIMSSMYTGKYRGNNIYTLNITARKDLKKACSILKFRKKLNVQKAKLNLSREFREGILRNRIPAFMVNSHLETLKDYLSKDEKYNFYYRYVGDDDRTISRDRLGELVSLLQERVHTTEKEKNSLNVLRKLSTDNAEYVKIKKVVIKKNVNNIPSYDLTPERSKYFVAGNGNFTLVEDTMLDLLVNSLRMRPDRIVMGEIRTQEQAEVLFEAMHTGHSVYATVHADSIGKTIARLVNPPINVPSNLLTAVNLNVVMFRDRRKGIRRVLQVGEFIAGEEERHIVNPNILYRFRPRDDMIVQHNQAIRLFEDLSMHTGLSYQQILDNLAEKVEVLKWMVKKNIRKVDEV
ncbi:MAG: ATPase, T2SS/T4P/T4SS family [Nanoarchaeota archaeon]